MAEKTRAAYGSGAKPWQRADGLWVARIEAGWNEQGKRRRITVNAKTEAECKARLKRRQRELALGKATGLNVRETVQSWSKTWLPRHAKKVRPTTYTTDAGAVRKWIVPTLGHRRLTDLNPGDLRRLEDAVRAKGRSSTTALHAHKTLITMLKAAIVEGHNVPDRVMIAPKPSKAANDRAEIQLEQALAILDIVKTRSDAARWFSALPQGMRQGESLGLTWECVDFNERLIDVSWQLQTLPYLDKADRSKGFLIPDGFEARHLTGSFHLTRPKTAHGQRTLPLIDLMAAALEVQRASWKPNPWGLIWTSPTGQPIRDEDDRAVWHALQDAAEVKHPAGRHYHLHETRQTVVSLLLRLGVDRAVIEAIVGHSKLVETYVKVNTAQSREAMERLTAALQIGQNSPTT